MIAPLAKVATRFYSPNYVNTNPTGFAFNVFYGVHNTNTASGGDTDFELVPVPGPGTWAFLLGILVAFARRSRKNYPG